MGAAVFLILAACGQLSQGELSAPTHSDPARFQQLSFTGVAELSTGRLQIAMAPQAALGTITQDANGDPGTVSTGTAQIYAPSVSIASGGAGYPVACNPSSPQVMFASVEVFSGFTEQLRNVYARLTSMSGGQTFCSKDPVGSFGSSLNPNVGLYLYQPLDRGSNPASAVRRPVQWALNLPDNGAFWFDGALWAEVIPQLPTALLPADAATLHDNSGVVSVPFSWVDDPLADGANPEGFLVSRPQAVGAQLTILQCGKVTAGKYDPATCVTPSFGPTVVTSGYAVSLVTGYWYQWSIRAAFLLPGDSTPTIGTLVSTRHIKTTKA